MVKYLSLNGRPSSQENEVISNEHRKANKKVGHGSMIVFYRLQRFYITFNVVAAVTGSLSLAVLTFDEFHPTISGQSRAAEGFMVSSASTSVISIMLATMFLFRFEGHDEATRQDLALAWVPLVLLDWSIIAFLVGLLLWYGEKNNVWRTVVVGSQTGVCLLFTCWAAVWMWKTMREKGGLGREDYLLLLE